MRPLQQLPAKQYKWLCTSLTQWSITYHIANLDGALCLAETETERESENVWSDEYWSSNVAVLGNLACTGRVTSSGHRHHINSWLMTWPQALVLTVVHPDMDKKIGKLEQTRTDSQIEPFLQTTMRHSESFIYQVVEFLSSPTSTYHISLLMILS